MKKITAYGAFLEFMEKHKRRPTIEEFKTIYGFEKSSYYKVKKEIEKEES